MKTNLILFDFGEFGLGSQSSEHSVISEKLGFND